MEKQVLFLTFDPPLARYVLDRIWNKKDKKYKAVQTRTQK